MDSEELHLKLLEQENAEVRHYNWLATVWGGLSWLLGLSAALALGAFAKPLGALLVAAVAGLGYGLVHHCHERVVHHRLRSLVHWERMPFDDTVHEQVGEVNRTRPPDTSGYTRVLQYALVPLMAIAILLLLIPWPTSVR
jgi:hypothetical protein